MDIFLNAMYERKLIYSVKSLLKYISLTIMFVIYLITITLIILGNSCMLHESSQWVMRVRNRRRVGYRNSGWHPSASHMSDVLCRGRLRQRG